MLYQEMVAAIRVNMVKVQELIEPELNDEFASKVGPFKNVGELREDIEKQLKFEKQNEADRDYESQLLKEISSKSSLSIPEVLLNDEIDRRFKDVVLNLSYRGQTLTEFLDSEGQTEEEYKEKVVRPEAEERLKSSIILSEISELEKVPLSNEEIDARIQQLKSQYKDPQTQAELSKPESRREIASRLLAEKTIQKLKTYLG